jgi:hypothetical protein
LTLLDRGNWRRIGLPDAVSFLRQSVLCPALHPFGLAAELGVLAQKFSVRKSHLGSNILGEKECVTAKK